MKTMLPPYPMSQAHWRFSTVYLAILLALLAIIVMISSLGWAARVAAQPLTTFVVTHVNFSGPGSLRQAILDANANPGPDDILFDIPGCTPATPCVITLPPLFPLPAITDPVRIMGPGMDSLIIDANHLFRVFNVANVPTIIIDVTIEKGATTGAGAGIRAFGPLTLARVRLMNNQAEEDGGGVFAAGPLTINDSLFVENNSLNGKGGGLYAEAELTVSNSEFINNGARYSGGGVYANDRLSLENVIFTYNTAIFGGGATGLGEIAVTGGLFNGNEASDGGGLFSFGSVILTGTVFISNTAYHGGGLQVNTAQLSQAWFEGNESSYGGGVYANGDLALTDVQFFNNTATYHGGGLWAYRQGGGSLALTLTRVHFISNTASNSGGGLFAYANNLLIDSSVFADNQATYGGGLSHVGQDSLIVNTLFAHNTAVVEGASLLLATFGTITVKHATIIGKPGNVAPGISLDFGSLLLKNTVVMRHATGVRNFNGLFHQDYNLFYQNGTNINGSSSGGANSITGDPKFIAPETGDFRLGPASAALDAGTNAGVTVDFEGDSRPLGSGFDIGYDEAGQITGLAIAYTPYPTATIQTPALFTATVSGGSDVVYSWDFGDGSPAVSGNPVSHQYPAPGLYLVTVTASNSYGSDSASAEVTVVQGDIDLPQYTIYLPVILK